MSPGEKGQGTRGRGSAAVMPQAQIRGDQGRAQPGSAAVMPQAKAGSTRRSHGRRAAAVRPQSRSQAPPLCCPRRRGGQRLIATRAAVRRPGRGAAVMRLSHSTRLLPGWLSKAISAAQHSSPNQVRHPSPLEWGTRTTRRPLERVWRLESAMVLCRRPLVWVCRLACGTRSTSTPLAWECRLACGT